MRRRSCRDRNRLTRPIRSDDPVEGALKFHNGRRGRPRPALAIIDPGETSLWAEAAPAWPIFSWGVFAAAICFFVVWFTTRFPKPPAFNAKNPLCWARYALIGIWYAAWSIVGLGQLIHATTAWSTSYVVTDRRVVIVSWLLQTDYVASSFTRYGIERDGNLTFECDDYSRDRRYLRRMRDLDDPEAVAALITAHVAPNAQRIDDPDRP